MTGRGSAGAGVRKVISVAVITLATCATPAAGPEAASAASGTGVNITAVEGASFTKRVANIDSCVFDHATIDWGDGSTSSVGQFETGTPPGVTGTHTYAEEGTFHGTVNYVTDCTPNGAVSFTATVADVPIAAQGRDITVYRGQAFTGVVSHFTDQNLGGKASDFTAKINWGDGTQSAGTISGGGGYFDVTGTHTYQSVGQAAVNVTIADKGGTTASSSSTASIFAPLVAAFSWSPPTPCAEEGLELDTSSSQAPIVMLRFTLSDWLAPGFSHGPDIRSPGPKQSFYVWRWYSPNGEAHEGQLVDVRRPPTTITLDVFDGAGHMASVQHTVAFSDSHVVYRWVRGVQDYYGVPMTVIYLKRVTLGKCTSARDLPLADASGRLSGDTVSLVGDKSVTTTVSCSPRAECVGSLYAARARSRARSARRRRLGARLGRAAFSMPGGTKRKVVIRLNKRGRRLAHRRQLRRIQLVLLMRAHKPQLRTVRVRRRGR